MGLLISVLTVLFVIVCLFLIIVILLQSDKSAGMGILGGAGQSTFGSSTADIITKVTTAMVVFLWWAPWVLLCLSLKGLHLLRTEFLILKQRKVELLKSLRKKQKQKNRVPKNRSIYPG